MILDIRELFSLKGRESKSEETSETNEISVISILKEIKEGNKLSRDYFISRYKPFILRAVSNSSGKRIYEDDDEFGIGMEAFNEAINCFDLNKKTNFFGFSELVIRRRITDYVRRKSKDSNVYPFSSVGDYNEFETRYLMSDSYSNFESIEAKDEIIALRENLLKYGITFRELASKSPRHKDSRRLCVGIARVLAQDEDLYNKLVKNKSIPRNELLKKVNVHRRTIENNRKFIIAVCLIFRSNLEISKNFFNSMDNGGGHLE